MNKKVIKMINSYTKKRESERAYQQGESQVSRKRALVFGSAMLLIAGILLIIAFNQKNENNALGTVVEERESVLAERKEESRDLEQQITQLNDDNYIMRIARSEFFLSEDGEIIFNFADDGESETENNSQDNSNSEE